MRVYVLEYDLRIMNTESLDNKYEHKKYCHTDIVKFIEDVRDSSDKWYITNIKTYMGDIEEIDINKVLNPFK